ncbi:MAG TPA: alpha/beta hydrolase [Bryobacteraceae bacterium]|nr:alpha/beta hydrolase [Bryobacteraceae bacterium]
MKLRPFWITLAFLTTAASILAQSPLPIAREGYFFAGGKYSTVGNQQVMSGQMYVEYQIPVKQTHRWPIVMVHGLGQSGTNFTGTPDGREGWAQFFLRRGYAVYVIDQPGRGRAAYEAELYGPATKVDLDNVLRRFIAPERYNLWPQAHLHTQWPGKAAPGDATFDQFYASQEPSIQSYALPQELNRDSIVALLEKIGPAIVLTHSQSGGFGWPVGDARPDLVKAIVAVEPSGPPFIDVQNVGAPDWFHETDTRARPWGLTAVPLKYSPSVDVKSLTITRQDKPDGPDLVRCWLQTAPVHTLPNLANVPILIITAEASYHAPYDHCTVKYLEQVGAHPSWTRLGEAGIHGNGHMMMLEKNNEEIAALMSLWLDKSVQ